MHLPSTATAYYLPLTDKSIGGFTRYGNSALEGMDWSLRRAIWCSETDFLRGLQTHVQVVTNNRTSELRQLDVSEVERGAFYRDTLNMLTQGLLRKSRPEDLEKAAMMLYLQFGLENVIIPWLQDTSLNIYHYGLEEQFQDSIKSVEIVKKLLVRYRLRPMTQCPSLGDYGTPANFALLRTTKKGFGPLEFPERFRSGTLKKPTHYVIRISILGIEIYKRRIF